MQMIRKTFLAAALGALLWPAVSVAAGNDAADGTQMLPVAFEALRDGKPSDAVTQLSQTTLVSPRDPSRLINLGTAFARLGRTSDARAMYQAAVNTPIRYDLELADGRYMDSRWAARIALAGLQDKPRVTVELADAR